MSDSNALDAVIAGAQDLRLTKSFQLASAIVLLYDHAITFSEEVEQIWTKRITGVSILFFLNRYLNPLFMFIVMAAYHDPGFRGEICNRFVRFEGYAAVIVLSICEFTMILRVIAFYDRSPLVVAPLLIMWTAQTTISLVGFAGGKAVQWPSPELVGCVMVGDGPLFASGWIAALITNTTTFTLTLFRSGFDLVPHRSTPLLRIFMRDGAMYFAIIFVLNAFNTFIYFFAVPDLKALSATFTTLITSVLASRLVLNLRSASTSTFTTSQWDSQQTLPLSFLDRTFEHMAGGERQWTTRIDNSKDIVLTELNRSGHDRCN